MTTLSEPPDAATPAHRPASRDPNLDLLRCIAIVLVVIYHSNATYPVKSQLLSKFCELGQFGVELFFVLSGWLIGGLYWREKKHFGEVRIGHFWARRLLRTLPPYFVGLALAWAAVFALRRERFDLGYLVFIQNYYDRLPYFVISWSLCVEEHFYLLLPVLLLVFRKLKALPVLAVIATVLPAVLRVMSKVPGEGEPFPYYRTHLRLDGLAIGIVCSYLAAYNPVLLQKLVKPARVMFFPLLGIFLSLVCWPLSAFYAGAYTTATWLSAAALISTAGQGAVPLADSRWVRTIAISSYSLYLTHTLSLLAVGKIVSRFNSFPVIAVRGLQAVSVFAAGYVFYLSIERGAILFRDRFVPRIR